MVFLFNNNRALYRVNLWETIYSPQTLWSALFLLENTDMIRTKEEAATKERQSRKARKAYQKYHGVIPEGIDIHHKDRNKDNNAIENLEALTRSNHIKKHALEDSLWGWKVYHQGDFERSLKNLELELYFYNNNLISQ